MAIRANRRRTAGHSGSVSVTARGQPFGPHQAERPSHRSSRSQLAYDSALVAFARHLGIESSPEAFDPPQVERTPSNGLWPHTMSTWPGWMKRFGRASGSVQVPEASRRAASVDRSSSRAAKVAAWVRRSIPSLASRLET